MTLRSRRSKRPAPKRQAVTKHSVGRCAECGKACFLSRKAAKSAARALNAGDRDLYVYACGIYFHFGHRPSDIRAGTVSRAEWGPR